MYDNNHDNNGTYLTIQDVHEDDVQCKHILQFLVNLAFIVDIWVFCRFKMACECVENKKFDLSNIVLICQGSL